MLLLKINKAFGLAILAFFLLTGISSAQKTNEKPYTVSWGPDVKMKGAFPDDIIKYNKDGFFISVIVPKIGSYDYSLAKFNSRLDMVLQEKIKTEESDKKASHHNEVALVQLGEKIYVIEKEKFSKDKNIKFFAEVIDENSVQASGNKEEIYTIDYSGNKDLDDDIVTFDVTEDNKYLVVVDNHYAAKKERPEVTIKVLDQKLNTVWTKEVAFPYVVQRRGSTKSPYYIDSQTNFYFVSKVYKDDKKNSKDVKEGELNYDYHIYIVGKDSKKLVDYPFHLKDKGISDVRIDVNTKGELMATGIYSDVLTEKNRISSPRGIFFTIIDPENKAIKSQSYKEFDAEFFTEGLKEREAKRIEKKMEKGKDIGYDFVIKDLVPRGDGGSTMIAEEFLLEVHTYTDSKGGTHTTYVYNYRNILVAKILPTGVIEWISIIPKRQRLGMPASGSYIVCEHPDDSYTFFYNEDRENMSARNEGKKVLEVMDNPKKATLVYVDVAASGKVSKREEAVKLPLDDEKTKFYPRLSFVLNDEDIVMYGTEKSHDKFVKFHFTKKYDKAMPKPAEPNKSDDAGKPAVDNKGDKSQKQPPGSKGSKVTPRKK